MKRIILLATALAGLASPAIASTSNNNGPTTNTTTNAPVANGGTGIGVGIGIGGNGGNAKSSSASKSSSVSKSASKSSASSASASSSGGNVQSINIQNPVQLTTTAAPVAVSELHDLTANRPGGIATAEVEMSMPFSPDISDRYERDGVVLTVTASNAIKAHARKSDADPACAVGFRVVDQKDAIGYILAQPIKRGNTVNVSLMRAVVKRYLDERYTGLSAMTSSKMLGLSVGVDGGGRGGSIAPAIGGLLRDMTVGAGVGVGAAAFTSRPDAQISAGFVVLAQ